MVKHYKISFLLLAWLLCYLTVSAHDFEVNGIYYKINGNEVTVTYCGSSYDYTDEYSGSVSIPTTVSYNGTSYSVTAIGDEAFRSCSSLTSLSISNTIKSIGSFAFAKTGLTTLTIPNSVLEIKNNAFGACTSLTSVVLPSSITKIYNETFYNCTKLASVSIPNSVLSIGDDAFYNCDGLNSITIPSSVTDIDGNPFRGCFNLTSIIVQSGNPVYDSRNSCNAIIKTEDNTLISGCTTTLIPNTVTSIGSFAFAGSGLTTLTIPNSVLEIKNNAFGACTSLTSVVLPSSITKIYYQTFYNCTNLASISIPNSVFSIGDKAFYNCDGLNSIIIPSTVTDIGGNPFESCSNLTSISVQSGNTVYDSRNNCNAIIKTESNTLISGCATTLIPNTVTSIGSFAFAGTSLSTVTIPNSVLEIKNNAFGGCTSLTSIVLPSSITKINDQTFYNCWYLASITIPDSVTSIGNLAFYNCYHLTSITIPSSVTRIDTRAFDYCYNLSKVTCMAINPPTAYSNSFYSSTYSNAELSVPYISVDQYNSAQCWKEFSNISGFNILVNELSLDFDSKEIYTSDTLKITATILPEYASNKTLNWTSSNPSVASVNSEGTVIGKSVGTAVITATTKDGSNLSASCTITVKKRFATSISINKSNASLNVGETEQLTATVYPTNATDKTVTWTSSNPNVATVSSTGSVTAVSVGNAIITASTADGSNLSASCSVVVYQLATSISLNQTDVTIYTGNSLQLNATVSPSSTSNPSVTWSSSNTSVATVSSTGVVTAKSTGTAVITARTTDGTNLSAQCFVTVKQYATSISLNQTEATIYTGNTLQLTATVSPSTTSNPSVTWSSSNTSVATVSSSGVVTAKSTGNAVITAKTADGSNLSASCNVTVKQLATSISLNKTSETLYMGNTLQLTATVYPNSTSDKSVSWSSDNSAVATVSSDGLVTPISTGTATITVRTEDGSNLTAQCIVTVKQYATSISLSETDVTICTGNTLQLTATVLPTTTSNPSVTWSSSNTSVATVSSTGLVTAKSTGTAVITAKTADGTNLSASCNVTVKRLATSISLNKTSATLYLDQTVQLTATVSPSNATDQSVIWSSSDNSIATVTSTGLVTAIAPGNAVITATTADGSNLSATCAITVKAYVTSLSFDQPEVTILEGDTITLSPIIQPSYATDQSLYWYTNNSAVASVNNGIVVGRSGGEATITARTADGSNLSATCMVTVVPNFDISMPNLNHLRGSSNNKFDLTIDLANRYDITGMQFDIQFPDGVDIVKDNNGEYDILLDDARKTRNHTAIASSLGNNTYRILISSATANPLKGHYGTVVHIMVEVPLYHVSGNKQIKYTNIVLSEPDETRHTLSSRTSLISYFYKEGDANADVSVDVADYVITGNYILQNNPENFWYDAANVDHNSTIDVNDLTGITNIALGRREGGILQMPAMQASEEVEDIELTANPLAIEAGQTKTLNLYLDGIHEFAGFQMDLQLPKGIRLVDASLVDENSGFSMATTELTDGRIRLLASAFSLKSLAVSKSAFLKLTLTAESSFNGNDIITLDNVKFSERNMDLHSLDNVVIPVGNDVSGLEQVYSVIRIYAEGNNIIIDTPESGTARIVTISGITQVRDVVPGHNVIPMEDSGFYIVTLNGTTAKLRLN